MVTMRSAGKANVSDMAGRLDHADSEGLLRDSGAWDSQTMHSNVDTSSAALEFSEA